MTSLIDRYVFTALRRVPEQQRTDIDRELRASIEDAVDARVDGGEPRDAAVEATLLELGDPDRLADSYAGRLPYLIGPDLFPFWRRLIKMLYTVVLPIVVAVAVTVQLFDHPTVGKVIGGGISALITTAVHIGFWTTLVFAILERTDARTELKTTWKPADLPKYEPSVVSRGQLAAGLVWPVLLMVALIMQQFTFTREPVLDPANWSFWWPFFLVMLVLECGYQVWLHRHRVWTHTVTLVNAALGILTTVPLVWLLATHHFYNPKFIATLNWGEVNPLTWLTNIAVVVAVATAVWDVAEVAARAERARRGLATKEPGSLAL
ncbi:permease prefix domain 1-containing protein [Actinoplanes sp. NPDC051411]|uniref:permease prefix domain 1-containing protein n=1 Tax=Actinoplanes sp. NPDC051411 TaxID=3155522 RepID=UPI003434A197